jgi:hypothetical protein
MSIIYKQPAAYLTLYHLTNVSICFLYLLTVLLLREREQEGVVLETLRGLGEVTVMNSKTCEDVSLLGYSAVRLK